MKKILVMNGPNLNLTGIQQKECVRRRDSGGINREAGRLWRGQGRAGGFLQSNHEGALIDKIHASRTDYDGVVLNAGAYTHYSYAIRDAIEAVQDFTPYVEVHMSDIHQREDFRRISVLTPVCVKQICGFAKTVTKWVLFIIGNTVKYLCYVLQITFGGKLIWYQQVISETA